MITPTKYSLALADEFHQHNPPEWQQQRAQLAALADKHLQPLIEENARLHAEVAVLLDLVAEDDQAAAGKADE